MGLRIKEWIFRNAQAEVELLRGNQLHSKMKKSCVLSKFICWSISLPILILCSAEIKQNESSYLDVLLSF